MSGINVKEAPFGAAGDGVADDTPAIQAAIDYLANNRGGTLGFPEGQYVVNEPGLVVPRGSALRISLRGAGRSASSLYGGSIGPQTPLIKYGDMLGSIIDSVWEDLSLHRGNPGTIFECLSSGDHQRMVGCVFRNLHFQCIGLCGEVAVIHGMLHCLLDTVSFQGDWQSRMLGGSHFETHNLSTTADHAQVNALKIIGGNCTHQNTRTEACAGGVVGDYGHPFSGDVAQLAVDEVDTFRVAFSTPTDVTDLTKGGAPGGFEGQQVRLIFNQRERDTEARCRQP
jgi:hypothetical protein